MTLLVHEIVFPWPLVFHLTSRTWFNPMVTLQLKDMAIGEIENKLTEPDVSLISDAITCTPLANKLIKNPGVESNGAFVLILAVNETKYVPGNNGGDVIAFIAI